MDDQAADCADKLAFDTREAAEAQAATAQWQYGSKLGVYRCPRCSLWHLTSQTAQADE